MSPGPVRDLERDRPVLLGLLAGVGVLVEHAVALGQAARPLDLDLLEPDRSSDLARLLELLALDLGDVDHLGRVSAKAVTPIMARIRAASAIHGQRRRLRACSGSGSPG